MRQVENLGSSTASGAIIGATVGPKLREQPTPLTFTTSHIEKNGRILLDTQNE